jgi:hypothetical protein
MLGVSSIYRGSGIFLYNLLAALIVHKYTECKEYQMRITEAMRAPDIVDRNSGTVEAVLCTSWSLTALPISFVCIKNCMQVAEIRMSVVYA